MTESCESRKTLFDNDILFGDDYLYFYDSDFTPERNTKESAVIWQLLSLQEGDAILDLGCGHGRMAIELAKRGGHVTGLDASTNFLDIAREATGKADLQIDYVEGDMRNLRWQGEFNAVVIWFTTFGYFEDSENLQVLKQVSKALKPGGRLLIEQMHRNAILRRGLPRSFVVQRGNDFMIDHVDYDAVAERTTTERITIRDGQVRRTNYAVRLYGLAELSHLLTGAGFQKIEGFGRDGEPLTTYSNRLLVLATKAEDGAAT